MSLNEAAVISEHMHATFYIHGYSIACLSYTKKVLEVSAWTYQGGSVIIHHGKLEWLITYCEWRCSDVVYYSCSELCVQHFSKWEHQTGNFRVHGTSICICEEWRLHWLTITASYISLTASLNCMWTAGGVIPLWHFCGTGRTTVFVPIWWGYDFM